MKRLINSVAVISFLCGLFASGAGAEGAERTAPWKIELRRSTFAKPRYVVAYGINDGWDLSKTRGLLGDPAALAKSRHQIEIFASPLAINIQEVRRDTTTHAVWYFALVCAANGRIETDWIKESDIPSDLIVTDGAVRDSHC